MLCNEPDLVQQLKRHFEFIFMIYECVSYKRELSAVERILDACELTLKEVGDRVAKSVISKMAQVEPSTLRKPYVREFLEKIGVETCEQNNRFFKKTS